jgi:hypothetical protein
MYGHDLCVPHIIRKPGILGGTTLAVFMTLVHTVNDAMTAILGALLPTQTLSPRTYPYGVSVIRADATPPTDADHSARPFDEADMGWPA